MDIKWARRKLGLTQEELAGLMGVHPLTVSRWERKESAPPRSAVVLIEHIMDERRPARWDAASWRRGRSGLRESSGGRWPAPTAQEIERVAEDMESAAQTLGAPWALIGGQVLVLHGIFQSTRDVDAVVGGGLARALAEMLAQHGWVPLSWQPTVRDYLPAPAVEPRVFDDPVVGRQRAMYPLASRDGVLVEILEGMHPAELEAVSQPAMEQICRTQVPTAEIGTVLLLKYLSGRRKDMGAIAQTAESLPDERLDDILEWIGRRDPQAASGMRGIFAETKARQ